MELPRCPELLRKYSCSLLGILDFAPLTLKSCFSSKHFLSIQNIHNSCTGFVVVCHGVHPGRTRFFFLHLETRHLSHEEKTGRILSMSHPGCLILWLAVSIFFCFSPYIGDMIQFDEYFFKWVGSTTNQYCGWF